MENKGNECEITCPFCNRRSKDILFETENFYVTPSVGQIIEGYLLICSKKHLTNMGQLQEKLFKELVNLQKKCTNIISKSYAKPFFFEHGAIDKKQKAGSCIDHAHLHVIPLKIELEDVLKKKFKFKKIKEISELKTQKDKEKPYFYYENQEGKKYVFELPEIVPSQYIRQIIAQELEKENEWNWKTHPYLDRFNETIKKIRGKHYHSFRISVKSLIVDKLNRILLVKRRDDNVHYPGAWEIPGGRIELGEDPFEGLKKQTKEETNLEIKVFNPLNVRYFTRQDGQRILMITFLCTPLHTEVRLSDEHVEYEWANIEDSKNKITKEFLEDIEAYEKFFKTQI